MGIFSPVTGQPENTRYSRVFFCNPSAGLPTANLLPLTDLIIRFDCAELLALEITPNRVFIAQKWNMRPASPPAMEWAQLAGVALPRQ
jgi:hypothetical protein